MAEHLIGECPSCGAFFRKPRPEQTYCSRTCSRRSYWKNAANFAPRFRSFLAQPEVKDPIAVERAFWRCFGRR